MVTATEENCGLNWKAASRKISEPERKQSCGPSTGGLSGENAAGVDATRDGHGAGHLRTALGCV